jgi:hypothetical protein
MIQQIKVFTSELRYLTTHEEEVNNFLKDKPDATIKNEMSHGYSSGSMSNHKPQLVTVITYKELS